MCRKINWLFFTIAVLIPSVQALATGQLHTPAVPPGSPSPISSEHHPLTPFAPVNVRHDLQLFAPADLGDFGYPPDPPVGYFFTYERLNWWIGKPEENPLGAESAAINARLIGQRTPAATVVRGAETTVRDADLVGPFGTVSTVGVAVPETQALWGNRYQIGWMQGCGAQYGWMIGILDGPDGEQRQTYSDGQVLIGFDDPLGFLNTYVDLNMDNFDDDLDGDGIFGRDGVDTDGDFVPDELTDIDFDDLVYFPPVFDSVQTRNRVVLEGVEVLGVHRFDRLHNGMMLELFYGARYLRFEDRFTWTAIGGNLPDSNLDQLVENDIIGPEVGVYAYRQRGRWIISGEGRFMAGWNIQDYKQNVSLDTMNTFDLQGQTLLGQQKIRNGIRDVQFSPVAEMRLNATYVLTKSFSLTVGWTGLFIGEVGRAANTIVYRLPEPQIRPDSEDLFNHGVNFGVNFNR